MFFHRRLQKQIPPSSFKDRLAKFAPLLEHDAKGNPLPVLIPSVNKIAVAIGINQMNLHFLSLCQASTNFKEKRRVAFDYVKNMVILSPVLSGVFVALNAINERSFSSALDVVSGVMRSAVVCIPLCSAFLFASSYLSKYRFLRELEKVGAFLLPKADEKWSLHLPEAILAKVREAQVVPRNFKND